MLDLAVSARLFITFSSYNFLLCLFFISSSLRTSFYAPLIATRGVHADSLVEGIVQLAIVARSFWSKTAKSWCFPQAGLFSTSFCNPGCRSHHNLEGDKRAI